MYTVTHNNTVVVYKHNMEEVNDFIRESITPNLGAQQIVNVVTNSGQLQLIVYRYYTRYCEFFMIEKEN